MIEKFGYNEKPLSDEEWLDIGNKMKSDPHIRYKTLRMVAEAEQYLSLHVASPKDSTTWPI